MTVTCRTARRAIAFLLAVLLIGVLAAPFEASAAPTAQDRAAAKAAWARGKQLEKQGKLDEAVTALREAADKDPKAQYQLDLARALAKNKALIEAVAMADAVTRTKEPNAQRAKMAATTLKKELDAKIPSVKVEVQGADPKTATVWLDGDRVDVGSVTPLDPGPHSVKGKAGDQPEVTQEIELAESEKKVVTLDLTKRAPEKTKEPEEKEGGGGGNMAPAAVLYAVGGAGLAVGAVLGVLAFNKTGEVEELCGGTVCPPQYADDVALAQDYGTGSTVAFAFGGLCVAAGIILTVTVGIDHGSDDEDEKKKDEQAITVTPYIGPTGAGITGTF